MHLKLLLDRSPQTCNKIRRLGLKKWPFLIWITDFTGKDPTPQLWGKIALERWADSSQNITYQKILSKIVSSQRFLRPRRNGFNLVTTSATEYDAYDRDIAILNVFFETPTVLEYTTQHSKTWLDIISATGGNGGLFIGFSIVTILEIIWLIFQATLLYLKG